MTVAVEQDPARFYPLVTNDFHLTLINSVIEATGWLIDPQTGTRVTQADITHSLDSGAGNAVLDVPGITFGPRDLPAGLTQAPAPGDILPPAILAEMTPLPKPLIRELPRVRPDTSRYIAGRDVLLVQRSSGKVLDVLSGIVH